MSNTSIISDLEDILKLLEPALRRGLVFKVYIERAVACVDLDTRAKSECILKKTPMGIKAFMRYDVVKPVQDFNDVLLAVQDCAHGRTFFNEDWVRVLKDYDFFDPRCPYGKE